MLQIFKSSSWSFTGLTALNPYLPFTEEPRAGASTADMSHQRLVKDHLPQSAGKTMPYAAQDTLDHICCKVTLLLIFILLSTRKDPMSFSAELFSSKIGVDFCVGVIPLQKQNFMALNEIPLSQFLQPVDVSQQETYGVSASAPGFLSSVKLLRVHFSSWSASFMKMLNIISPV